MTMPYSTRMAEEPLNARVDIRMTSRQRAMLVKLANRQRRTMSDAARLAIERVYMMDMLRAESAGSARAKGTATGRSE